MSVVPQRITRRRGILATFGALAVLVLAYGLVVTAPSASAATNVLIKGVGSGRCLAPPSISLGQATIQNCGTQLWSTDTNQQITIGGLCLDAKGEATANSTVVTTYACHGRSNQKWTVNSDGTIRGVQSGRCLDVKGQGTAAGTRVQLYDCNGGSNQKWQLVGGGGPVDPPSSSQPSSSQPSSSPPGSPPPGGPETIGGGTIGNPAQGPGPSSGVFGSNYTLVKNWNFGSTGTVRNQSDMDANFYYHDQFGTIANGSNYGAITAASSSATAISTPQFGAQPVDPSVRQITGDSIKTFLKPLGGATTVSPSQHNAINGSFMAKFPLPRAGSLLGQDILWETRVKYVTPKFFWFAIWNAGVKWNNGAEFDVVESFGWQHPDGGENFNGRYWHSDPVGGTGNVNYSDWPTGMRSRGINSFDGTQYHVWSLLYKKNNTFGFFVDGIEVQSGTMNWTDGGGAGAEPIEMYFLFDAGWGHTGIGDVNKSMPASEFNGKFYEFDYSRVYLRP